ncbi:MAG: proton-conducting transporter membrane subunit [Leptospiraceae bacterium]|nr:proton-conducting transporter membrane subunit [Leptospiraceae bacterium]
MMQFYSLFAILGLFLPILVTAYLDYLFLLSNKILLVGFSLETLVGASILYYLKDYEVANLKKIYLGYGLFFLGIGFSYIVGKSYWLCFFWELTTLGTILINSGNGFTEKTARSLVSFILASGVSMLFLGVWVFLPVSIQGTYFLLIGLLLKTAFLGFHIWYPIAYSSVNAHSASAYSGALVPLSFLLAIKWILPVLPQISILNFLLPLAGLGVFVAALSSFFNKNILESLAYSTIENMNLLWVCIFAYGISYSQNQQIANSFQIVFYLILIHHSISKSFQFLSLGYLSKIGKTTNIDELKGVGRISKIPSEVLGFGTFSFVLVPGTIGFLAEVSFLFLSSKFIEILGFHSTTYMLVLFFVISGFAIATAAHLRNYLTIVLSIPSESLKKVVISSHESVYRIKFTLQFIGSIIFFLPIIFLFFYPNFFDFSVPEFLVTFYSKIKYLSIPLIILYFSLFLFRWFHKIEKRKAWDCGNSYSGSELSIPSSIVSDPLYDSVGRYLLDIDGKVRFEKKVEKTLVGFLNFGNKITSLVESETLSHYILFSSISFLFTIALIISLRIFVS